MFEILSINLVEILSMIRKSADFKNHYLTYCFYRIMPFVVFNLNMVSTL